MLAVCKLGMKSFLDVKCILYFEIQDSCTKICDLNANTESEVPGDQSGVQGEAACVQIPHLDLKTISDGDKWEGNFTHMNYFLDNVLRKWNFPSTYEITGLFLDKLTDFCFLISFSYKKSECF